MRILVFDIDGTLTRTASVDGRCFAEAVRAVLSVEVDESFEAFEEHTDAAILRQIHAGRSADGYDSIAERVHRHFLSALRDAFDRDPDACRAIDGATTVLGAARASGWTPAIATGGWRESAMLKLTTARIPTSGVPLATSSEDDRRVDIIRAAVRSAAAGRRVEDVVYVGDGPWDVRACSELGIGFVGRCDPDEADRLHRLGARATLPDFADPVALFDVLSEVAALRPDST